MWLYPQLYIDTADCDDTSKGTTHHEVTYAMGPPAESFAVSAVRVDLMANGIGSSVFGDVGWFSAVNPYYEHSFVQLDVSIAQLVDNEWHYWPLVSDRVFSGKGEYVSQIRALLSGQTYPVSVIIRKPDLGGGDLLCYVQVMCSTQAVGTDGRVRVDFGQTNVNGIYLGGVALIGDSV